MVGEVGAEFPEVRVPFPSAGVAKHQRPRSNDQPQWRPLQLAQTLSHARVLDAVQPQPVPER